jgi:Cu2+-exporting ATPase
LTFVNSERGGVDILLAMLAPRTAIAGAKPGRNPSPTLAASEMHPQSAASDASICFHCGDPNPSSTPWRAVVNAVERRFCCAGCLGVAQAIAAAGLDRFYRRRESADGGAIERESDEALARSADGAEAGGLVVHLDDDLREASLLLDGIHCGACVWLVESYLARQTGVVQASVNLATHRARVRWDARRARLSDLLRAISAIGYRAHPYDPGRREAQMRGQWRALLARAALAMLAMMQVMMFSLPAYTSADGVEPQYRTLLDWASLALTLPVVLYCATPFFAGAWRDVRLRQLGMDVPVAIGIGGAFVASAWSTLGGGGAVYYDSVTMFVALLLVARLFELRARRRAGDAIEAIAHELPETAERLLDANDATVTERVAAHRLRRGDLIRVAAGATVAADGTVIEGRSSIEEAILTGESWPRATAAGDRVFAGSINRESPLLVRVDAAGEATAAAALVRMIESAANARPRAAQLADRVARKFVVALLAIAAATALVWWHIEPARMLMITLAVLVVSCPCALSLATPAALAAAAGAAGRQRIFAVRSDAWEALARVTHVVFDKTGTLTSGRLSLRAVEPLARDHPVRCIAIATALEVGSTHPIAQALQQAGAPAVIAHDIVAIAGNGTEGIIEGRRHRFGRPDWVAALHGHALPAFAAGVASDAISVALGSESGWVAWFSFADAVRPGARQLVATLQSMDIAVSLLSGDRGETVKHVAEAVGIVTHGGDARPADKLAEIASLQRAGTVVAMVGDGINDAPSLARADVSLSFASAAPLTQWTADVIVADDDPLRVATAIASARQTSRVIRQNLVWAFGYNVVAIPLAATGHLTPLAAALGMSMSSLLVVANAMRLSRAGGRGEVRAPLISVPR